MMAGIVFARKLHFGPIALIYFLLILIPALSPLSAYLMGVELFTLQNPELQQDLNLNGIAILLTLLFSGFSLFGFLRPITFRGSISIPNIMVESNTRILVLTFFFIMFIFFLESGNIVTSDYANFKSSGSSPFSSLVNQAFNAAAAIILVDWTTRKKQRVNIFFLLLFICFCLVVSRRTLALGLIIFLIAVTSQRRISVRMYITIGLGVVLLFLVGLVRDVGLSTFFLEGDFREKTINVFYLPGGASNVYMTLLTTLDLDATNGLPSVPDFGPWSWFSRRYEGTFIELAGYDYNGGFFIVALVYFHTGVMGIAFLGYILGVAVNKVEAAISEIYTNGFGRWSTSVAIGFLIVLPNTLWYHPVGFIKLFAAITVGYMVFSILPRKVASGAAKNGFAEK